MQCRRSTRTRLRGLHKGQLEFRRYGDNVAIVLSVLCALSVLAIHEYRAICDACRSSKFSTGVPQHNRLARCMSKASHNDGAKQARAIQAANADLTAARNEFYFRLPGWLEARLRPLLQDQRDLPILYLFFNVSVTVLPAGLSLFACPAWAKLLGPLYLACSYVLFLERYLLALHYSQHRRLFKRGSCVIALILSTSITLFFLQQLCHCRLQLAELYRASIAGATVWSAMWLVQNSPLCNASCGAQ